MKVISPKKLIEVALPLDAINEAAAREKSIRHGHPSTLHLWWARRPLAAARAVIFSQLVNDPEDLWRCQNPGVEPNKQVRGHWTKARAKLFRLIEELVKWENTTNERVINEARETIKDSWRQTCELNKDHPQAKELFDPEKMPGLHDPFAGGGAIPLEAQRLGLDAYASDLNPVAVLINKAMIEIPPKFAGKPPVNPEYHDKCKEERANSQWNGAHGLADDVRYYGKWMRDEAEKRIGHLYPKIEITKEMAKERPDLKPLVGQKLTVIAWLWARTVKSPNPAYSHIDVPLASTFILNSKVDKEAYVQPIIEKSGYRFTVKVGKPPVKAKNGTKLARGANFRCLMSDIPMEGDYIKSEGLAGRMNAKMMAIVAEGARGRVYLPPTSEMEVIANSAKPSWKPDLKLSEDKRAFWTPAYGVCNYGDLFTPRQLIALTTFSDLVGEVREVIHRDAITTGLPNDDISLDVGGTGARAYAEAVSVYLAFGVDRQANRSSTICFWDTKGENVQQVFARQAIPMTWDFTESNPLSFSTGNFTGQIDGLSKVVQQCLPANIASVAVQCDAQNQTISNQKFISTDPPYYDNIGYADLSDYFYVWMRRSLRPIFPGLLATIAVPKAEELVAAPFRHGTKEKAEAFFLNGMTQAMKRLAMQSHPAAPLTIYYAFKQSDTAGDGTNSTGWETFLGAVISSGLSIVGTWPMRTELVGNLKKTVNALASSIILVCRHREKDVGAISRRQFVRVLNDVLPIALDNMTRSDEGEHSPVAPVDLSQAIIGPGMAIFSRYDAVLEADGTLMTVKAALQLINRFLAEEDFDSDTQFCLHWFEQYGWEKGKFGEAEVLSKAKGTSVDGVKQAGVIESGGGNVRLMRWKEYPTDWDPETDIRLPVWEALHHLIRTYNTGGDSAAAKVFAATINQAEAARQLAYRLYTLCERKGWADDARAYNEIVTGWSNIESEASKLIGAEQLTLPTME